MIAYNKKALDDRFIHREAGRAHQRKWISDVIWHWISEAYPEPFYSPNFFARLGLFILTVVAWSGAEAFVALLFIGSADRALGLLWLISGVAAVVTLEILIRQRKLYRSGIDDALLYIAGTLIFFGCNMSFHWLGSAQNELLVLILAIAGSLRYSDRLLTLTAYGALIALIADLLMVPGSAMSGLLPFVLIALSAIVYFAASRLVMANSCRHYKQNLELLRVAALLTGYLAGNYYVVREANAGITGMPGPVALGWLWWMLTILVPLAYIFRGVQKKDIVFLWTGLLLVGAAIFTFRYYYHVLPAELAMVIGGAILTGGALALIRYLRIPRNKITSEAPEYPHILEHIPVEAIILAETFRGTGTMPDDKGFHFGGGTTGGGGAGGTF